MIYTKNINDIKQLLIEQKKVKILYVEALNKKEELSSLQQLRKRIKLLAFRIDTLEFIK